MMTKSILEIILTSPENKIDFSAVFNRSRPLLYELDDNE